MTEIIYHNITKIIPNHGDHKAILQKFDEKCFKYYVILLYSVVFYSVIHEDFTQIVAITY